MLTGCKIENIKITRIFPISQVETLFWGIFYLIFLFAKKIKVFHEKYHFLRLNVSSILASYSLKKIHKKWNKSLDGNFIWYWGISIDFSARYLLTFISFSGRVGRHWGGFFLSSFIQAKKAHFLFFL